MVKEYRQINMEDKPQVNGLKDKEDEICFNTLIQKKESI